MHREMTPLPLDEASVGGLLGELAVASSPEARCLLLRQLVHRVWVYDLSLALSYAEEAVTVARDHGLKLDLARGMLEAGRALRLLGRYAAAEQMLVTLKDILLAFGDRKAAGLALRTLSAIHLDQGYFEQALDLNSEALTLFATEGDQRYYSMALMECAEVFNSRRQFDDALATLDDARMRLALLPDNDVDDMQWLQLKYTRARVLLEAGRYGDAVTAAEETIEAAAEFRCRDIEVGCFGIMALAHARLRHFVDLERWLASFLATIDATSDPFNRMIGWLNCGRAMLVIGNRERALDYIQRALQIGESVGLRHLAAACHGALSEICEAQENHREALRHFKAFYEIDSQLHHAGVEYRISQMQLRLKVDQSRMQSLEGMHQELERQVTLRTQQLSQAKDQAELANRSKSDFLAFVSHELRTPLNAIIGFAELIQQQVHGPVSPPKYLDYLKDIQDGGKLMLSLINDLLDVSKIEAGKQQLSRQVCTVQDICAASFRLIAERAEGAGVHLTVSLPPEIRALDIDIRAVKQVLLNLLTNAIKFTPKDGYVTLFATDGGGPFVTLGVSDTGVGITPDNLPRVLEPFEQVHPALVRIQEGTGLGLPLAKMLTALHGGELSIDSKLGVGTVVKIRLPAANSHATGGTGPDVLIGKAG